jgi:hypothetical protein
MSQSLVLLMDNVGGSHEAFSPYLQVSVCILAS